MIPFQGMEWNFENDLFANVHETTDVKLFTLSNVRFSISITSDHINSNVKNIKYCL